MISRQVRWAAHLLVLHGGVVPLQAEEVLAARSQDGIVELTTVAVCAGVLRSDHPRLTCREAFDLVGLPRRAGVC